MPNSFKKKQNRNIYIFPMHSFRSEKNGHEKSLGSSSNRSDGSSDLAAERECIQLGVDK
jgi:hypothetical protein